MADPLWFDEPQEHDFPAALDYLTLLFEVPVATKTVQALRKATTTSKKAKDIVRACSLSALGHDNAHVRNDLHKINRGEKLSPVLLVRGDALTGRPLTVADGYHRVCAVHLLNEDAEVPCRLVSVAH